MSRIRKLPPDFSQQKKPRMSVDSLMTRFEFVDQEQEEQEEQEEELEEEFENDVSESILDDSINEIDEKIIEEEEEPEEFEFMNYESILDEEEEEEEEPIETTEYDINLINDGQPQQGLNPRARMTPRMRVNTDYIHHSIQLSQWVEEEIEEEEVEDDINEFADQDMTEYLETRTYHVVADHEEQEACAICLLEYQHEDTIGTLQCSHEFHVECINKWLQRKTTCPFCRASVLPTSLF